MEHRLQPPLGADLLMRLEKMPADARQEKIEHLKTLTAEALQRENYAAANYFLLNGLGLGDADKETLWGGAVVPAKRKAAEKKGGKKAKKAKRAQREVEEEEPSASEEEDEDKEEERASPPAASAKPRRTTAGSASTRQKAWAERFRAFLVNAELGEGWSSLVGAWWGREESNGFTGTVSLLILGDMPLWLMTFDRGKGTRQRNAPPRSGIGCRGPG